MRCCHAENELVEQKTGHGAKYLEQPVKTPDESFRHHVRNQIIVNRGDKHIENLKCHNHCAGDQHD